MTCDSQIASFVPHQWSAVLAARRTDASRAIEALAALSQPYRQPLYSYLRLRGHSPEEARELTGEFFGRLLQNRTLAYMKRDCAKLRSFLLTALNRFLSEREAKGRAKADGGESLEKVFERNWALALSQVVYDRLQGEYQRAGQGQIFAALKFSLAGACESAPWNDLAGRLNCEIASVKDCIEKMRRRYGELLREEIRQVVATAADAEEELRCLFPAVAVG